MAPPAKIANVPATLPGDFFDKQEPPQTLPGNFFDEPPDTTPEAEPPLHVRLQRAFDEAATPPALGTHPGVGGAIRDVAGDLGAGATQLFTPLVHPIKTAEGLERMAEATIPGASELDPTFKNPLSHFAPQKGENGGAYARRMGANAIAAIPSLALAGEEALPDEAIERIPFPPTEGHAGAVFQSIRKQASDVPVTMENTLPKLQRFEDLTAAGGKRSKPFTQLYKRVQQNEPVKFPEARDFYTNITDAAHQTPLQRWLGRGMKPTMRRAAVDVRRAFNDDITNAADQVGRGEDFSKAMREYRNAARLHKVAKIAGAMGAAKAAQKSGFFGQLAHKATLGQ